MSDPTFAARPTLEEVAARAGVSRATVSRVVNGSEGVRAPLAERVRAAVDELGYVPNQAARTLVTRRNGAVAVVVAEPETRFFADPFFAQQVRGISKELTVHDNQLVLLLTEGAADYQRVGRYLAGGHVDGALIFSLHDDNSLPEMARRAGVATVIGGRPGWSDAASGPTTLYVDCDNRGGARDAVRHLLGLGRRRIAHIAGPLDQTASIDRLDGFRDVLPNTDPALVAEGDFTPEGGALAMEELLKRSPDLDAVFAASDVMASGALRVLRRRGLRVPEDVAVIGFDDIVSVAEWTDPPLTTIRQDIEEMGRMMARLLLRALESPSGDGAAPVALAPIVTPTQLVVRASA
ncbi:LacI family DNA-binding transcriptional regulator [Streptomyces sp. NRRL F-5123]|uniref:LacI family DNA-binding transcriptional regulator n=1 Tax=Streptomyces sp. NRRL F-5123 TaxID=1463856 RepID=UPI0004E1968B|nr:LacI family DNA-binding transcriptional regulator [Streptomyces sp. NRRL F-5123]